MRDGQFTLISSPISRFGPSIVETNEKKQQYKERSGLKIDLLIGEVLPKVLTYA